MTTNRRRLGSRPPRAYDECDDCGRPLRDPVSLAAGRGPVCRRKDNPPVPRSSTGPAPLPAVPEPTDQLALWSHTVTEPEPPRRPTADDITAAELDALYAELDKLHAELGGRDDEARERWIQKQLDETGLRSADFRNGMAMDLEPAREMVAHWVAAARAMLGDAPNYTETPLEMHVKVAEAPERFAFVLQRVAPGALTPHQARQRAERERDEARQAVEAVHALADRWAQLRDHGSAAYELRAVLPPRNAEDSLPAASECPAGLLPLDDAPAEPCVRRGPHDEHETAEGRRWTANAEETTPR